MPGSFDFHNDFMREFVTGKFAAGSSILDVGAGAGKYGKMFGEAFKVDALEIYAPNISQFKLDGIYAQVHHGDVRSFVIQEGRYDLVIMGDVLEHLKVEEAQAVLSKVERSGAALLILVPYEYHQGAFGGNEAEVHHQPDLTENLFNVRYPGFTLVAGNAHQGVFFKSASEQAKLP